MAEREYHLLPIGRQPEMAECKHDFAAIVAELRAATTYLPFKADGSTNSGYLFHPDKWFADVLAEEIKGLP